MSHSDSKRKWDSLTDKEKEKLWKEAHGTGLVPDHVSGTQLDNLFKNTYEKVQINNQADNPWRIPD